MRNGNATHRGVQHLQGAVLFLFAIRQVSVGFDHGPDMLFRGRPFDGCSLHISVTADLQLGGRIIEKPTRTVQQGMALSAMPKFFL